MINRCLACLAAATFLIQSSAIAQNGMSQSQFDSYIFQQHGTAELTQDQLMKSIGLQVRRIEQATPLSSEQKQKLRLAGEGDIQHFFNRVIAARKKFQALDPERADFNEAYQIVIPLQMELASGLFDNDSLFAKVAQTTLNAKQLEVYQKQEAIREQREREAYVLAYISSLEASFPMTGVQREALVRLLTANLDGPRHNSQIEMLLVAYRLLTIPEEQLAENFDPGQIAALRKMKVQLDQIEQILRMQGVLDDAE